MEGCSNFNADTSSLDERLGTLFGGLVSLGGGNARATTIGSPAAMGTLLGKLGMEVSGDDAVAAFNEANDGKPIDRSAFIAFMKRSGQAPNDAFALRVPPARSSTVGAYNVEFQAGPIGLSLLPLGQTGVVVDGVADGGQAR